jgi:hypothetical protein
LPEPVSPQTMTTGFASTAARISSCRPLIGSAGSKRTADKSATAFIECFVSLPLRTQ